MSPNNYFNVWEHFLVNNLEKLDSEITSIEYIQHNEVLKV